MEINETKKMKNLKKNEQKDWFVKLENAIQQIINRVLHRRKQRSTPRASSLMGFTVVELLVASAIFTIFLTIAVGSFTRVIQVQRVLSRRMALVSSLGSVMESMTREIRIGYKFEYPNGMDVDNEQLSSITFENFATHTTESTSTTFSIGGGAIMKGTDRLTPSDVVIKSGNFYLNESSCGPWRVTIALTAHPIGIDKNEDTVSIQTTVASRVLPAEVKGDPYQCKQM
ncbi:MAG: type II secretion system protein [Candidatus Paceibacterota bacterium]|jgi:type II secretory pathway pseudopilin PulG